MSFRDLAGVVSQESGIDGQGADISNGPVPSEPSDATRGTSGAPGRYDHWVSALRSGGASIYAAAASVVVLVLTSRALGPAGRGEYATATGLVTLVGTIGSLSLGQVILHHATGKPRREWAAPVTGTLIALLAAITAMSWLGIVVGHFLTGGKVVPHVTPVHVVVAFLALPFLVWYDNGRYVLFALGRVDRFNQSQMVGYTVYLALVLALALVGRLTVFSALSAWMVLYLTLSLIGYRSVRRDVPFLQFDPGLARGVLRGSARLHWSTISTFVHLQSSVLILNYYRPAAEVGFYQLATQITALGTIVPMAASSVAYGLTSVHGPDAAWGRQRALIGATLALAGGAVVIGWVLAPLGVTIVAGPDFAPAISLVRMSLFALIGMTLSMMMASQWISRGFFRENAIFAGCLAGLSLLLDFTLIPRYGMHGAVVSTLAVYVGALIVNGVFAWRIERRWRGQAS